jgi:hypothetical protein
MIFGLIISLCRHASNRTKILSADIPRTIKTVKVCMLLKYVTLKIPSVMIVVIGKLRRITKIPIVLKNMDYK